MWMRLSKFSLLNRLSLHALASLVAIRADEACCAGVDLRRADRFVPSRLCSLLEIAQAAALDGFCLPSSHPALAWSTTELRYCPKCLERGFHAAWFQWRFIKRCPVHGSPLQGGCQKCAAVIPFPSRAPITGRFAPQRAAGIEIRMLCRANCIQLLNQFYDVPPPSLAELTDRCRVKLTMVDEGRIVPSPDEDWETDIIPLARDDWPHFDDDFLEYERVLKHVGRDLFGDTRRIAPMRLLVPNRYDAIVAHTQDMNADQATALGWSISWYGFSRTCAPEHEPCMPAVGLTGWLAHAPHRPAEFPPEQWREQMSAWLAHDPARSACAWARIARFMRAREKYLFHALLVRPAELARLHLPFQGGTQSFALEKIFKNSWR